RHTQPDDAGVLVALADDAREPVRLFPGSGPESGPKTGAEPAELLCLVDPSGVATTTTAESGATAMARPAPVRPPRARWRRTASLSPRRVASRFWVLGGVLAAITIGSAIVLASATGLNLIEAVYDVVGAFFGGIDSSVANSDALRVFAIVLTLVGAA